MLLIFCLSAQDFTQRGFVQTGLTLYPETAPNDSGHAVGDALFRYEASYKVRPWLRISAALDAAFDTHEQVERSAHLDWQDRSLERPMLSLRELNATISKGKLTAEFGKQFIRWGKADLLNPTDRFAPKDFLSVTDPGFLAVTAARVIYDTGSDSFDLVWQPRFTPSRTPLLDQRWTVLPESLENVPLRDLGSLFPGRSSFGARWNHIGSGYEVSASFYDGFNSLPVFQAYSNDDFRRIYPALRLYGADAAVPLPWFTVKAEAAYYTSPDKQQDEYVIYVIQFERQIKELAHGGWLRRRCRYLVHAGIAIFARAGVRARHSGPCAVHHRFHSQRGYGCGCPPERPRQLARTVYSQSLGQHWRITTGFTWIRGDPSDFLGQYHRNSYALLALRYSF